MGKSKILACSREINSISNKKNTKHRGKRKRNLRERLEVLLHHLLHMEDFGIDKRKMPCDINVKILRSNLSNKKTYFYYN